MSWSLTKLALRIRDELLEIEHTLNRAKEGLRLAKHTGDDHYIDGVALNLHCYYSGIERIFELVAENIDGSLPRGENWHQVLLEQMSQDVEEVRPAVISGPIKHGLDEYRGFRHIVRNIYTYKFDLDRIEKLITRAEPLFEQLRAELLAFADFLQTGEEGG